MLVVLGGVAAVGVVLGVAALTAPSLRTPQERVEARVADALADAGVELAAPVDLDSGDSASSVWNGRLRVVGPDGTTSQVRIALRLATTPTAGGAPQGFFPGVDCSSPFPLTWPGDSDSSYRTTRADLAECVAQHDDGGVLVTVAWADDDDALGTGRQTWRVDPAGGVVWLRNGSGREADPDGRSGGLTGEQQRAVAGAEGLLDAV